MVPVSSAAAAVAGLSMLAIVACGDGPGSAADKADSPDARIADTVADAATGLSIDAATGPVLDGGPATGADSGPDAALPPAGPLVDRSDPMLHEFELDPTALDPTVSDSIEPQYAQLDTRVQPLGKLVFFLTGSTNVPRGWRDHGRQLAGYGLHVIIPHYNNRWSAGDNPCAGMGGSCGDDTRWEALTGEDSSSVVDIARADSAEGRAIAMLQHLVSAHPGGDWGYYLNADGSLRDEHVIIAGISHGATNSGLFGARRAFHRAVMHSGGYWSIGDSPATPIEDFYGLSHTDDSQHMGHLDSWQAGGLLGTPTNIDSASAPYGDTRQLITSAPNGYPHCSVAVSADSPVDAGGAYLFDEAWRYMYGAAQL